MHSRTCPRILYNRGGGAWNVFGGSLLDILLWKVFPEGGMYEKPLLYSISCVFLICVFIFYCCGHNLKLLVASIKTVAL